MPALFAYLIAVGLLLGGGYGAVSWLAAPEPVKVVAKGKQKPPSTDAQKSASTDAAVISAPASGKSPPQAGDSAIKPASNDKPQASDKPQSTEPARVTTREQGGSNEGANSNPDQPIVAHAETAPAETTQSPAPRAAVVPQRKEEYKQENRQESRQDNRRPVEGASASGTALNGASAAAAKPKRPSQRQASRSPEHRGLALMTLRTIQFPDGRRATMLIPYRGDNRRAMAIDPEW
jgi:hypothetical protein